MRFRLTRSWSPKPFTHTTLLYTSLDTIKNLLFAQHLSKLAENGYWIIFNYSWAIGTSNVDQNMAPTITNDDTNATKDEKTGMDICHPALEGLFYLNCVL